MAASPLRVLLVDDNPDDRALVRRALERDLGAIQAEEIVDRAAFERANEAGGFDLVVTDYQLLWWTGLDVVRAAKERWPYCPVVMFTATGNEEVAVAAMKSGLDDYVLKSTSRLPRLVASVRLALQNAQRQRDLDAAVRARDEFLSIAAHELKTPITSLRGYAQMALRRLRRGETLDSARLDRVLHTIDQQSERLARLVERLLDVGRLETGRLRLEPAPADLVALARRVAELVQQTTTRHTIAVTGPPQLEAHVDALRIEQVVTNVIDNAVKFDQDGGLIEVDVASPEPGWAELTVRDHGPGIPPERRTGLFERFHQAHGDAHLSGLGLGLYVSRQLVDLHGGAITLDAPPDGGTRVRVRLPVHPPT